MVITYFTKSKLITNGFTLFLLLTFVIIIMYQKLLPKLFLGAMFAL